LIRFYLFGPPRLERNGQPLAINLRKALALLVYLAVTRQSHSRDALATLFWPEKDQQSARANLRRLLYDLNQLLGQPLVEAAGEGITLQPGALWLDSQQFQNALAEDRSLLPSPHPPEPAHLARLIEAVDLYKDDFLAGFTLPDCPGFDDWQFFQREELRRAFAGLLQQLTAAYESQSKFDEALRYARRWLALDRLEERVHRRLMGLYAQAGQPAAALRQYEECVRVLAEELEVSPESETTALYEAIRTRRFPASDKVTSWQDDKMIGKITPSPCHPGTVTSPHNLPAQTTPFVGRCQELNELLQRLADPACRLLTLVGPGGIGKTRLALEAAGTILDSRFWSLNLDEAMYPDAPKSKIQTPKFPDGVFFVPLQPVNAVSGLVPAIAAALGFQFYTGVSPQVQLLNFLREKTLLLVLDNFEHLLAGAAVVEEILAGAPGIKLLVTSREALKLQQEWFHPLAGMRLPPQPWLYGWTDQTASSQAGETITQYDAVQLFVQSARRSVVTFDPEPEQEPIVRICRLVDGMPLGIELAASWLKVLSCSQIAQEIERGIDILVTRHQNVPARHRNIRVVMEQSWQLLDEQTQQVLKRLSVFQSNFLQEAAVAVTGAGWFALAEAVEKAWVYKVPGERYQMHELLRQFAAEKLAEAPTHQAEAQRRHAAFYLQRLAQQEQPLLGPKQQSALETISADIDNVLVAWERAANQQEFMLIAQALQAFYLYFHIRSRYVDGELALNHALQQLTGFTSPVSPVDPRQLRRRLLARLAAFRHYQGDLVAADRYSHDALQANPDRREQAFIYELLGKTARIRGERACAEKALHKSLALSQELGDLNQTIGALHGLSDTVASFGAFAESEAYARQALTLCRQLQRPDWTARVLASLAWVNSCRGNYPEAEQFYRESLVITEQIGNPYGMALAINFLGWMAFCAGGARLPEALTFYDRALSIWRQIGQRSNLAMGLGDYALAACELGHYAVAFEYAQEGLAITEQLNHLNLTAYNLNVLGAAACGLADFAASRRYLLRALHMTVEAQIIDSLAVTFYLLAQLLIQESAHLTLPAAEQVQKQSQALEWLTLVIHHPPTWQLFRDRARRAQADLIDTLPPEVAEAAIGRGQCSTLAEAALTLLQQEAGESQVAVR
jgi:DNA-binding SARP family transcriptional activator/predicted ATPase